MIEWNTFRLIELSEITMGQSPKGEYTNEVGEGMPLLNGPTEFTERFPIPVKYTIDPKKIANKGDLLWCVRGSTVGRSNFADRDYAIGRGLASIRSKYGQVHTEFIGILLDYALPRFLSAATGSTFPNVSKDQLYNAEFFLPDIDTQLKMADILVTLKNKIQLNSEINQTLEEIIMNIYKHWFVDFGPFQEDTFVDSELGMIPIGWEVSNIGNVCNIYDSKRIPLSNQVREQRRGPYPYYGATSIMDYVDDYLFDGTYLLIGEDGSVMKSNGVPYTQYVRGKFWVNNHAHVLQGANGVTTEWLKVFFDQLNVSPYVTGAVQPKINQQNLKSIPFLIPPNNIRMKFIDLISPLYKEVLANNEENLVLKETLEYILPILLNRGIEVL